MRHGGMTWVRIHLAPLACERVSVEKYYKQTTFVFRNVSQSAKDFFAILSNYTKCFFFMWERKRLRIVKNWCFDLWVDFAIRKQFLSAACMTWKFNPLSLALFHLIYPLAEQLFYFLLKLKPSFKSQILMKIRLLSLLLFTCKTFTKYFVGPSSSQDQIRSLSSSVNRLAHLGKFLMTILHALSPNLWWHFGLFYKHYFS